MIPATDSVSVGMRNAVVFQAVRSAGETYGAAIAAQLSPMTTGSVVRALKALTEAGLIERRDEDIDPAEAKRPARAYYRLTEQGEAVASLVYGPVAGEMYQVHVIKVSVDVDDVTQDEYNKLIERICTAVEGFLPGVDVMVTGGVETYVTASD